MVVPIELLFVAPRAFMVRWVNRSIRHDGPIHLFFVPSPGFSRCDGSSDRFVMVDTIVLFLVPARASQLAKTKVVLCAVLFGMVHIKE